MSYSKISFSIVFFLFSVFAMAQGKDNFPTWQKGYLDIHHINTGRGNCAFIVFPDGTNMMIDAGDFDAAAFDNAYAPMYSPPMFPNAGYTTGGAVYNYVSQILNTKNIAIDYFLLTHFHGDHYGAVREGLHKSEKGNYLLTGLTEVGDLMQIKKLVDRNYPDYNFPIDLRTEKNNPTFKNYLDFVDYHKKHGMQVEQLVVGAKNQFVLKNNPKEFPNFEVRNIKSNNIVWTGKSGETKTLFTKNQLLDKNGRYSENPLSTAIVIKYGNFAYFSGGDNTGLEDQDREKWQDIETPMAEVVGKISALTLNHHGNRDATNRTFLNTLDPKVVVMQSWCTDHPGAEVGHRLISPNIGTQQRDVYMTYYNDETTIGTGPWFPRKLKAKQGHIVIRAYADGSFSVFVLDDTKINPVVVKREDYK